MNSFFLFFSTFMQLNLKHIVRRDILIYPGYVPESGVTYKVFHYGLRFTVGNWSFDKADWRNTDMVNTCWAKFPEPPQPSNLTAMDEKALQRDLLSIECGRTLNRALQLHHEQRNCPLYSITNSQPALFGGKVDEKKEVVYGISKLPISKASSNISLHHGSKFLDRSLRIWMVGIWALSVIGFLVVISMVLSRRKVDNSRTKKTRKRNPYTAVSVKHYDTDSSLEA